MKPILRATVAAASLAMAASLAPAQPSGAAARPDGASILSLPSLGEGVELPLGTERKLGDRIAAAVYRDEAYLDDPVLGDYLQALWQPLMRAASLRGDLSPELQERFAWELFLVRDRSVNAFALPGGYLGVHTGLIAAVGTADELAAVLGHELSHVTQRHIARLFTQQQKQAPWVMAAMILGVMAASRSANAGNAAIVGGQALAIQGQLNFSRDMEREADRVGFGVMTEAGFAPQGVSAMFEKLQQANRFNDNGAFPYLRSHPLTTERIAEARSRVQLADGAKHEAGHSHASPKLSSSGISPAYHAMMVGRARALGQPSPDSLQARLNEARQLAPSASAEQGLATLYAAAWAAARQRDAATALAYHARLLKLVPAADARAAGLARLLGIEIDEMLGRKAEAAAATRLTQARGRAELLMQGRALLSAERGGEAVDALQTWVSTHPRDAQAWQMLSQGLAQQGQVVRAVRAEAESRAAQFDHQGAVDRLKSAQELLRSGRGGGSAANLHIEASIIDTRLRQLQTLVREQAIEDKLNR